MFGTDNIFITIFYFVLGSLFMHFIDSVIVAIIFVVLFGVLTFTSTCRLLSQMLSLAKSSLNKSEKNNNKLTEREKSEIQIQQQTDSGYLHKFTNVNESFEQF